jgi:RNA polymerase sigma factor (sigma-70 family)
MWEEIVRQEAEAWERLSTLVKIACPPVFRQRGVPQGEIDDLVQDVLVSVWKYASRQNEEPRNLEQFLKWRARGVFSRYFTQKRRSGALSDLDVPVDPTDDRYAPWDDLLVEELRRAIDRCRTELQERYRRVWLLRYEKDMTPQETAEHLQTSVQTVGVHLHRAKNQLWTCLKRSRAVS